MTTQLRHENKENKFNKVSINRMGVVHVVQEKNSVTLLSAHSMGTASRTL